MKLIAIGETGTLPAEIVLNDFHREAVEATVAHSEDGIVWQWHLNARSESPESKE